MVAPRRLPSTACLDGDGSIVAWCEKRQGYRQFRTARVEALAVTAQKHRDRRALLIKDWEEEMEKRSARVPKPLCGFRA